MSEAKFYRCNHCGNIVVMVVDAGVTPSCCGEPMELLAAGSTDAATEKHVPVVTREGSVVTAHVGEVSHPMLDEHYIQWVAAVTERDVSIHHLKPGEEPEASFSVAEGEAVTVYEYCNLHGLWKAEA